MSRSGVLEGGCRSEIMQIGVGHSNFPTPTGLQVLSSDPIRLVRMVNETVS